jgi:hypothetical protein
VKLKLINCGGGVKEAVTVCGEVIVTEQLPVPLHGLPHPANVLGADGVAVSVTTVPLV